MATKIFINGKEVTNPVARGIAAPFVALIAIGVIGLALLFLIPMLGLLVAGGVALLGAASVVYMLRSFRRRRSAPRIEEAEVIGIEDGIRGERKELDE